MVAVTNKIGTKCEFEDALDLTGFGRYNVGMLLACCMLILAMYVDIFGFSVVLPAAACDMALTTAQQGLLSAVPLIGVMMSSYAWGLCADIMGRRTTLLLAMPVGTTLNILASFAPTYATLAIVKFLSAGFTSSANAAGFVLAAESVPRRYRSRFMFIMASATMFVLLFICLFALPIFRLTFRVSISWLALEYCPWRLLLLVISTPGIIGIVGMLFLHESPKYLLSKGRDDEAMRVLTSICRCNTRHKGSIPVTEVYQDERTESASTLASTSLLRRMWDQTAPLFKPPLLKNSLKLYYILLCAYMTSTGYTMWIPTMTNAYFDGDDKSGQTFCEVASAAASSNNSTSTDCNNIIQSQTLYAVMAQSGSAGGLTILLSFAVGTFSKRSITLLLFTISASCGVVLIFVKIPLLSIGMFFLFLHISLILGNANTYLVELNPTHLRGMATSLSVVVARGFGFFSVQLIAYLMADYCTPMISGYVVLIISGLVVSYFLPPDSLADLSYRDGTLESIQSIEQEKNRF